MSETMHTSRRDFMGKSLTLLGASATVPAFLGRAAEALAQAQGKTEGQRILVVVQLAGGNDGLNTVIPFGNDHYYQARPKLAIRAKDVLRINDELGFHPAADGLRSLYDDGQLALIQGVGYPNPNRSHFASMDVWHSASADGRIHEGWLGRYFDACCSGQDSKLGVALTAEAPMALRGQEFVPLSFQRPENLRIRGGQKSSTASKDDLNHLANSGSSGLTTTLDFVRRSALKAQVSADAIRKSARHDAHSISFPGSALGNSLRTVARMIAGGMPTRVYYVSHSGFDTHANQAGAHRRLMGEIGSALRAFVSALKQQGDLDRTLIMSFSEFGRRVEENASGGTDHGEAAPMFLIGQAVKPGIYGEMPSLSKLHRGDLAFNLDFRRVYASILRDWLDADAEAILGDHFKPLPILRG